VFSIGPKDLSRVAGVDIYAPSHRIPYLGTTGQILDTRPPSTKGSTTVDGTSYGEVRLRKVYVIGQLTRFLCDSCSLYGRDNCDDDDRALQASAEV
jgi:hypothetical protein